MFPFIVAGSTLNGKSSFVLEYITFQTVGVNAFHLIPFSEGKSILKWLLPYGTVSVPLYSVKVDPDQPARMYMLTWDTYF